MGFGALIRNRERLVMVVGVDHFFFFNMILTAEIEALGFGI